MDQLMDTQERMMKAQTGYKAAVELVRLVSKEIYSRFNAMLTANSIIIAVIGWSLTAQSHLSRLLSIVLPFMGLGLCFLWFSFIHHGVHWHHLFRQEAKRLEAQYFSDTFRLILLVNYKNQNVPRLVRCLPFYRTACAVVVIFGIVYFVMLFVAFL